MTKHDSLDHDTERDYRGERLQRVLAQGGVASRRRAEGMITAGQIRVNGRVITELGTKVHPSRDEIRVDGKVLRPQPPRYIMLNKPTGFITTVSDERDRWTVMDLVDVRERVYPVGRLDRATQGLVMLTNDGDLAHRIMHPSYRIDKEYFVFSDMRPTEPQLQQLRDGVRIDNRRIIPEDVRLHRETVEGTAIKIVLHEGLYHVVRRLMDAVGIPVTRLRRTRLGPLHVQGIPTGSWRDLTPGELVQIFQAVGMPEADADRANNARTIQLTPVGGFSHQASGSGGAGRPAPRPEATSSSNRQERESRRGSSTETGRQGGNRSRGRGNGTGRSNRHDSNRSSSSNRNRRSGRRG